ncbi:MAG: DUF4956 domain-containing protein [Clostridia bacterium]|nr:DUF4956 domain-containing protein [Clostridia bacterium]
MIMNLFKGLFDTELTQLISVTDFLLCIGTALIVGILFAAVYSFHKSTSKSFLITLFMLPAVVCVVIMMVNGNVGAGVAVAGAFSLVRFRSVPGTAREICMLFLAMGAGLVCGMGYLAYALLFTLIMSAIVLILTLCDKGNTQKTLVIVIPEDLSYSGLFDDLFDKYTVTHKLKQVKTTNMGSLFKLSYDVTIKKDSDEKCFIDDLRCRNGNLEIMISEREDLQNAL